MPNLKWFLFIRVLNTVNTHLPVIISDQSLNIYGNCDKKIPGGK